MFVPHMNAREYTLLIGGIEKRYSKMPVPHIMPEYTLLIGRFEKGIPKCMFHI